MFNFFKDKSSSIEDSNYPSTVTAGNHDFVPGLVTRVCKAPNLDQNTYCRTDSFTVLCWLQNNKRLCTRDTELDRCIFCPGGNNPADLPSRSCRVRELVHNKLQWEGPEFLKKSSEAWLNMPTRYDPSEAQEEQVRNPPPDIVLSLPSLTPALSTFTLS